MGHWTINGRPACDAPETMGVTFTDQRGRESATFCSCSLEDFHLMSEALLKVHPGAVCEWHTEMCPSWDRDRDYEEYQNSRWDR